MKQLIFFLSFFYFYCVIAMEKLHPDTIALIICQPNYSFLNHMNIEGSDVASKSEKENSKQKIKNSCDIFMPGFKLLLTCKGYYNNAFKEKIKSFLTTRYIPQGTCLYFLPKSMHQEILQNNTYLEIKKLFEALTNLCVQEQPITLDSIQKIVNLNIIVSEKLKCIVYKGWMLGEKGFFKPYTFIEYLYEESRLKVIRMERRTNMFYIKTLKNIFFLIEYLYQKKIIDLKLPISGNGIRNFGLPTSANNQRYLFAIYDFISTFEYLNEFEGLKSLTILNLSPDVPPKEKPCEEPAIIGNLADLFLFSKYTMYLNKKTEMKEKQKAFALSLTELSHIETQKNIRKSVIKITFFLIFIMGIMSYCYANGSFNKI